jgi:hypothetical protein
MTRYDVERAERDAAWAEKLAELAWARVDSATATAQAAEAEAERCRVLAQRLGFQVGFRIPA